MKINAELRVKIRSRVAVRGFKIPHKFFHQLVIYIALLLQQEMPVIALSAWIGLKPAIERLLWRWAGVQRQFRILPKT
jgi:hypothetical protein